MAWLTSRPGTRVALIGLVVALATPFLARAGLMTNYAALVMGKGVALAAAGLSLNLLMGYAGQISLGQASLLGVGAFASGAITPADPGNPGAPFLLAILFAAFMGAAIAFLIGLPALRLRGLYLAVATIAFSFTMTESLLKSSSIGGGSAGIALPRPQINNFVFTRNGDYLGLLLALLALLWLLDTNVTRTTLGRAFRAIKSDEAVASSFGVDVTRYKLAAFALAGAMAGIAGLMSGHLVGTINSDSFKYEDSLLLVVVVVVGGLGSRVGVLVAAAFYALFPVVMPSLFGHGILGYDVVIGAALLVITMARNPGGLAATFREAIDERKQRNEPPVLVDAADMPKLPALPKPTALPDRSGGDGAVLACRDVRVTFGGLTAVDDASIEVPRGTIVGLIGPNGAGKTTLFNALSGHFKPDSGRVELLGRDVSGLGAAARARAGLGRTFQNIGLVRDLSVTENMLLAQHTVAGYDPASALGYLPAVAKGERELRERTAAAIAALGFERYTDTPVSNLSIGQQRIVELGCVLLTAPEVVLLDEPAAGMSPAAAENLAERLIDLRDELGRTVLLIEHNIPLVLATCDELYVMSAGQVIANGVPNDVIKNDLVLEAYLGGAL